MIDKQTLVQDSTRVCLLSCCVFCNSLAPPEPEAKEHEVKEIFEKVFVQEIKPLWMMLYGNGYQGDTQDVK